MSNRSASPSNNSDSPKPPWAKQLDKVRREVLQQTVSVGDFLNLTERVATIETTLHRIEATLTQIEEQNAASEAVPPNSEVLVCQTKPIESESDTSLIDLVKSNCSQNPTVDDIFSMSESYSDLGSIPVLVAPVINEKMLLDFSDDTSKTESDHLVNSAEQDGQPRIPVITTTTQLYGEWDPLRNQNFESGREQKVTEMSRGTQTEILKPKVNEQSANPETPMSTPVLTPIVAISSGTKALFEQYRYPLAAVDLNLLASCLVKAGVFSAWEGQRVQSVQSMSEKARCVLSVLHYVGDRAVGALRKGLADIGETDLAQLLKKRKAPPTVQVSFSLSFTADSYSPGDAKRLKEAGGVLQAKWKDASWRTSVTKTFRMAGYQIKSMDANSMTLSLQFHKLSLLDSFWGALRSAHPTSLTPTLGKIVVDKDVKEVVKDMELAVCVHSGLTVEQYFKTRRDFMFSKLCTKDDSQGISRPKKHRHADHSAISALDLCVNTNQFSQLTADTESPFESVFRAYSIQKNKDKKLKQALGDMRRQILQCGDEKERLQEDIANYRDCIVPGLENDKRQLETDIADMELELQEKDNEVQKWKRLVDVDKEILIKEKDKEVDDVLAELRGKEKENTQLLADAETARIKTESLNEQLAELEAILATKEKAMRGMKKQLEELKNSGEGQSKGVTAAALPAAISPINVFRANGHFAVPKQPPHQSKPQIQKHARFRESQNVVIENSDEFYESYHEDEPLGTGGVEPPAEKRRSNVAQIDLRRGLRTMAQTMAPSFATGLGSGSVEYTKPRYHAGPLPVGSRVRRGPDWKWGNQDGEGLGTVVKDDNVGLLSVQWDHNDEVNIYRYGVEAAYDILASDETRELQPGETIAVGVEVQLGPDWMYDPYTVGGRHAVGYVYHVSEDGFVKVRWKNGQRVLCRFGFEGNYDVLVKGRNT
ncbi:uncharacterized protein LOC106178850 isoform X2 [Lingula anatina]|uniref:Uncharacterized protein LOC106178850 isoform X2 n=1 Tax=Lingula anatina TaxID=7574 RepID=A0A1S3K4U7_LINAN|nr:uncharacterized protein LOC106178850 isoform X2 [Lingula anatina]|eukprot:XP_013417658.1 uncharacterized protein LOC106178850 isoform X2 [Lingula anatina]